MIPSFLLGPVVRYGGIILLIAAIFGLGFKNGLDWRADQIATAKRETEKAESDYRKLREEVATAMIKARDRAIEMEKTNDQARSIATEDANKRLHDVSVSADSLRKQLAAARRSVAASEVPSCQTSGRSNDSAAAVELAARVRAISERLETVGNRVIEAAKAEERLTVLQNQVKAHDAGAEK